MKILLINHTRGTGGGATIAAERLAKSLIQAGHEVRWLVKEEASLSEDTQALKAWPVERLLSPLFKNRLTLAPHRLNTWNLIKHPWVQWADVLHLHNLHPDFFNYLALPALSKHKSVVWTLHDMWSFTGHCAYSKDCQRWQTGCGNCPDLGEYPGVTSDWTRWEWRMKQWAVKRAHLHIVTPSRWLREEAKQSLLGNCPINVIPYGLDTELYQPASSEAAKNALGLDPLLPTVLLASASLEDPRKPQALLCEAINQFVSQTGKLLQVISFGGGSLRSAIVPDIPFYELGMLRDEAKKIQAFNAADVFLFASRADNLPLTIQESLACGTPVIANDVGGVGEMVKHDETGMLVASLEAGSFVFGLQRFFNESELQRRLSLQAREHALASFEQRAQAAQNETLYKSLFKS